MKGAILILYFSILHSIALWLFCNGFLLTRISLDNISTSIRDGDEESPAFKKAVILVIDALRHDFTVPQNASSHYWNHLNVLAEVAQTSPRNAFLSKFIADPPTTTLQRLKGLTTGSLPTFIDAGSNFAGERITEDNLLLQLKLANKRIAFVGDDTWQALFPDTFESALNYPFESLNVWDLDTVDDGVYHHLFDAEDAFFKAPVREQWDVVVAHALGLDHSGHRYGPDHIETTRKLKQMDSWVRELIDAVDDSTLLVVMGDHGMNPQGDHGGDSVEELEAALFMYSKRETFHTDLDNAMSVAQIDFVSTFALLMGLPIPFNNLGAPIPHAFPGHALLSFSSALQLTNHQIENYIEAYSEHSSSIKESLAAINQYHSKLESRSLEWQQDILQIFRQQWAQYDLTSIGHGLSQMMSIVALLLFTLLYPKSTISMYLYGTILLQQAYGLYSLRELLPVQHLRVGLLIVTIASALGIAGQDFLQITFKHKILRGDNILAFIALASHALCFTSNSFTIHEDRICLLILCFLLVSLNLKVVMSTQSYTRKFRLFIMIVCLMLISRVVASIRLCREEQMGFCTSNFYQLSFWSVQIVHAIAIISVVIFMKVIASESQNLTNTASRWFDFTFAFPQALSWFYWYLDHHDISSGLKMLIGRLLLIIGAGQLVCWYWLPLPVSFYIERGALKAHGLSDARAASYLQLVLPLLSVLTFLGRSAGSVSILLLVLQLLILRNLQREKATSISRPLLCMILVELMFIHFFSTGHQMALPFIQWDLAFLASKTIIYPLSPLLIAGNAFGSFLVVSLFVPTIFRHAHTLKMETDSTASSTKGERDRDCKGSETQNALGIMLILTFITFSTMVFATHFRRHLMVWKIFAPRFMTASLTLLSSDMILLASNLGMCLVERKVITLGQLLDTIQAI